MKVRYAKDSEKNIALKFWNENFTDTEIQTKFYFDKIFKHNNFFVVEDNDKIVSSLHENDYIVFFNEREFSSKYIVGVSTDITKRNKGYMNFLLIETLKNLKAKNFPFIFLTPINSSIYRKYGFEYFSKISKYNFNINVLSEFFYSKNGEYIEINNENYDLFYNDLIKIYEYNMRNSLFFLKRDKVFLKKLLDECWNDEMKVFLLKEKETPLAYIIYGKENNIVNVREIFGINSNSRKEILAFLYGFKDYYTKISLASSSFSNLELLFSNQLNIEKKEFPFMMLRILDPISVLKKLDLNIPSLKIKIVDPYLTENTGIYSFNGEWKFEKNQTFVDFEINISDFSMLISGFLDFKELIDLDKINLITSDKILINNLKKIFVKKQSYLYEFL